MTFEEKFQTRKIKANFHARMNSHEGFSHWFSEEVSVWFNEEDDGEFEFLFGPREPIIVLIRRAPTDSYYESYDLEVEKVGQLSELESFMETAQEWSREAGRYVHYIVKTVSWDIEEVYFE